MHPTYCLCCGDMFSIDGARAGCAPGCIGFPPAGFGVCEGGPGRNGTLGERPSLGAPPRACPPPTGAAAWSCRACGEGCFTAAGACPPLAAGRAGGAVPRPRAIPDVRVRVAALRSNSGLETSQHCSECSWSPHSSNARSAFHALSIRRTFIWYSEYARSTGWRTTRRMRASGTIRRASSGVFFPRMYAGVVSPLTCSSVWSLSTTEKSAR
mmetsp:Transcript_74616/g.180462  ORF Transcript_74616/g.180462 Transcript_74616/m.180462 type:complete len:211 (-) Transcript_74616:20-652(-)